MGRVILGIMLLAGAALGQPRIWLVDLPQLVTDPIPPSASGVKCAVVGADGSLKDAECVVSPAIARGETPGDCIRIETPTGIRYSCTDAISLSCPPEGCQPVILGRGWESARSAPSNEVVMQALEYGKTYSGKAVDVQILPRDEEASGGILLAITAKVNADFAIIEVLHREAARIGNRDVRLFRSKTQAVRVSAGGAFLSDLIPLKLEDVEKINVRLVTESNVVEFWSDTSEIKKPVK